MSDQEDMSPPTRRSVKQAIAESTGVIVPLGAVAVALFSCLAWLNSEIRESRDTAKEAVAQARRETDSAFAAIKDRIDTNTAINHRQDGEILRNSIDTTYLRATLERVAKGVDDLNIKMDQLKKGVIP